jgi:hypothetical protein
MRSLAVRVTLLGIFAIAAGVSAYLFWMGERGARDEARLGRSFNERTLVASRDLVELGAAQQAYVAAGQGEDFWTSKVTTALTSLKNALTALRAEASSLEAQSALDSAAGSLQDFETMDRRAREFVRTGAELQAADLIFTDGFELRRATIASLERARTAELQVRDEAARELRQRQVFAAGAAGAAALLAIVLLVPRVETTVVEPISVVPRSPERLAPVGLNDGVEGWTAARRATDPPWGVRKSTVDVAAMALLCSDLARVVETRSLAGLLERTAVILDAAGIVLWISDPDGRELTPIVTHGYLPPVVVRLGTIARDAQNATAAAFRTGLVQTVRADPVSNGAIAAPLVTTAGTVGVLSAEMRNAGERDQEKLAAAAIVAAQLATLVGPPSSRSQPKTEAAGA